MLQRTVVTVELVGSRCRQKVMKLIATFKGITSIVLDLAKNTVTVIGEADPVRTIKKVRKFRKSAAIECWSYQGREEGRKKRKRKRMLLFRIPNCIREAMYGM